MDRRKFVTSSTLAAAIPFGLSAQTTVFDQSEDKEWYELRSYEIKFGGNKDLIIEYLKNALMPAMKRAGANNFMVFSELNSSWPYKVWAWIGYPDIVTYGVAQNLSGDSEFQKAAKSYNELPIDQTIFNQYSSWLLSAFDGLPKAPDPIENAGLFELRTYESYSEDALRRKIKMFNDEELDLFFKVKLNPLFFGEMIAGPYRPCLTYMINFKDMAENKAAWNEFGNHPEWKRMSTDPKYANAMSNLRHTFLEPIF